MIHTKIILVLMVCFYSVSVNAQVEKKIKAAYQEFEKDSQLSHAISSLYVIDAETGKVVFDKNSQVGLAGASTQKIVTAATAFEILGKGYQYTTSFYYFNDTIQILGSGDPTLGSNRYSSASDTTIIREILNACKGKGIKEIKGFHFLLTDPGWIPPGGWINEDLGNYYGAGVREFNWNENQYDLVFIPSKVVGYPAKIDTSKTIYWRQMINQCVTGAAGSGDNAYIYFIPGSDKLLVKGTVPAGTDRFTISGADIYPEKHFAYSFEKITGKPIGILLDDRLHNSKPMFAHYSPTLDSICYWFLRKSINFYGEALANTMGLRKKGSLDSGAVAIKDYWRGKGIDENELNIYDGSGLSPLNRLTTHAQVEILKYAKGKDWFPFYFAGFPEYNGMRMKSGTINDVKGYCGYHKSKEGNEYIFSFLVNNYNGRSASLVNKMFKVLDELK